MRGGVRLAEPRLPIPTGSAGLAKAAPKRERRACEGAREAHADPWGQLGLVG